MQREDLLNWFLLWHGFIAVAALAEMSWLNIVSRPQNQEHVHSAVFEVG